MIAQANWTGKCLVLLIVFLFCSFTLMFCSDSDHRPNEQLLRTGRTSKKPPHLVRDSGSPQSVSADHAADGGVPSG
jgi:hypothetical protein